jgi:DNA primase large subunit
MLARYEELVAAKVEPAGKMVGKAASEKERRSSMMQDAAGKLARRIMAKGYRALKDTEVIALEQEEFALRVERELADLKRKKAREGFLDR